jgi:alkylation response protein AidB-like acyl-CoA dehydrogenase
VSNVLKPLDRDPDRYLAVARATDESASDQLLTEREAQVRDQVREVVATEVAPRAAGVDAAHAFAHDSYQALAAAGLAGLIFPRRWGGTQDTHVAYAVAMEEIAAGCAATSLIYMTQTHAAYPIGVSGSEELARRYIPGLLDGTRYGSLAITEPDAGSDVASLKTRAAADGGDGAASYAITGSKTFITTGDRADVIVCFATVDPSLGRKGVTALVVDGSAAGLTRGRPFAKMGMHGSSTAELFFSDVRVPAGNRIGAEGDGWPIVMASVVKSRISAAAQGVGIARAAYTRTLLALHEVHGRKLPDEATFALADLRGDILRGRLLLLSIAREVDRSASPSPGQIGIMKQSCTDLGWRASIEAARILGPFGDLADLGVERCLRDAKVTQIYDGTNEVQRMLIGRDTTRALGELL